MTDAYIIYTIW